MAPLASNSSGEDWRDLAGEEWKRMACCDATWSGRSRWVRTDQVTSEEERQQAIGSVRREWSELDRQDRAGRVTRGVKRNGLERTGRRGLECVGLEGHGAAVKETMADEAVGAFAMGCARQDRMR